MPMHTENIILHVLRLKAVGRKSDVTEVCTSIPDPRDLCSNKENLKSLIGSYGGKVLVLKWTVFRTRYISY